jgi:DNA replication regulator SLD3
VDIETLSQSATVVCRERMRSSKPAKQENAAAVPLTTPSMYNESKRRRLAIEEIQSLVRKKRSMSVIEKESQIQTTTTSEEKSAAKEDTGLQTNPVAEPAESPVEPGPSVSSRPDTPAPVPAPMDDPLAQPDAEEIFQNIRAQYMEALYHSKVLCYSHIVHRFC